MTLDKEKVREAVLVMSAVNYGRYTRSALTTVLAAARAWLDGQDKAVDVEVLKQECIDLFTKQQCHPDWAIIQTIDYLATTGRLQAKSASDKIKFTDAEVNALLKFPYKPASDMVLVPREPTQEILDAMNEQYMPFGEMAAAYDAMITAAEKEKKDE